MADPPSLGNPSDLEAHDVLAAEEFALPAPDPTIAHAPVVLPQDPSGIAEPHDVLAAEEFALPALPAHPPSPAVVPARHQRPPAALAGAVGAVALLIVALRRRLRSS